MAGSQHFKGMREAIDASLKKHEAKEKSEAGESAKLHKKELKKGAEAPGHEKR